MHLRLGKRMAAEEGLSGTPDSSVETPVPDNGREAAQLAFFNSSSLDEDNNSLEVGGDDQEYLRSTSYRELPDAESSLRVADLFSGCGGLTLGVREACVDLGIGFRPTLAADTSQAALECFDANFSPAELLGAPLEEVFNGELGSSLSDDEQRLRSAHGDVDLLLGGPPCKGHSDLNNSTRRDDPKNALYSVMARAAEVLQPEFLVVENVVGALHDRRRVVQTTRKGLDDLGYRTSLGVVDMGRIGVPQNRKRVILLASRSKPLAVERITSIGAVRRRDVRWAIGDLIDAEGKGLLDEASTPSAKNQERINYLLENDLYELPNEMRPPCHQDGDHSYVSVYGRLRWDEPAQTVTSGFYSTSMGRYVHPEEPRTITAHEAARLQFFPEHFDFSSVPNRTTLAELIGNAVPMKLSYLATLHLLADEQ